MSKFFTTKKEKYWFELIVKKAATLDKEDHQALGEFVNDLFNKNNIVNHWNDFVKDDNKEEILIIEILKKGWKVKFLDGVYYYEEDNI